MAAVRTSLLNNIPAVSLDVARDVNSGVQPSEPAARDSEACRHLINPDQAAAYPQ